MLSSLSEQLLSESDKQPFMPTRESLLSRVRDVSSNESWQEFFETYWKLIYNTARSFGLSDAEAQEVVQDTMIGLAQNLPTYRYDPAVCHFKSWLWKLIVWRVKDRLRRRFEHEPLEAAMEIPDEGEVPDSFDRDWDRNLLNAAMERVKLTISPRTFQVFAFCFLQKRGVADTAKELGVSRPAIYLARHRVLRSLRRELKEILENSKRAI